MDRDKARPDDGHQLVPEVHEINAGRLIFEQLEADGAFRSFEMCAQGDAEIVIAFAQAYRETRVGPVHFRDSQYEVEYSSQFESCRIRLLGNASFTLDGDTGRLTRSKRGIRIPQTSVCYYVLSLPEFAILTDLKVSDTRRSGRSCQCSVTRDDLRCRYVAYLECSSSEQLFDFELACTFVIDPVAFPASEYCPSKPPNFTGVTSTRRSGTHNRSAGKRQPLFVSKADAIYIGDMYSAGRAGAMGPGCRVIDSVVPQNRSRLSENHSRLVADLRLLQLAMRDKATSPEHERAVKEIAAAEAAASQGNTPLLRKHLRKAGRWALDVSTKTSADLLTVMLKAVLGL